MSEGRVYDIPESGFKWFKEKMDRLGRKAEKLVGEKLYLTVVGFHFEHDDGVKGAGRKILEVFVAHPEPKLNGWEFVARVDHANEIGNVIRVLPGMTLPEQYRNTDPVCDHCGYKRRRRDTFVVHHCESDEFKQVGSSCLKDFLGHEGADKWAKLAEMVAGIGELARGARGQGSTGIRDDRWINTQYLMECAAEVMLAHGWVSRKTANEKGWTASAERAFAYLANNNLEISDTAAKLADDAREWAQSFGSQDGMNDWEHNCYVVASSEAMEDRSVGVATSIVGVYFQKFVDKRDRFDPTASQFQGSIGDKVEMDVTLYNVWFGDSSTRHDFHDEHGNVYVWFATSGSLATKKGEQMRIKGTIKAHNDFRNVKQTLINRVKLA